MHGIRKMEYSYNDDEFYGQMLNYRIKRGEEIYGLFYKDFWKEKKYTKLMKLSHVNIYNHPREELAFYTENGDSCRHFTEFIGADAEYVKAYNSEENRNTIVQKRR